MQSRLSYPSLLAIIAVVDIAINGRVHPVISKSVAKRLGLPSRYLDPVLQALARSGILTGIRGHEGGYQLTRTEAEITVYDIVQATADLDEADRRQRTQSELVEQVVRPALLKAEKAFTVALSKITIAELARAGGRLRPPKPAA